MVATYVSKAKEFESLQCAANVQTKGNEDWIHVLAETRDLLFHSLFPTFISASSSGDITKSCFLR